MNKQFVSIAALLGAIAVTAGAFGAHFLKERLNELQLQTFETAVRYQFYHVFALLAAGILYKDFSNKMMLWAGRLFIAGIVLFSGSLYLLGLMAMPKWIGAVTPLGGLCFIAGWLLLAAGVSKTK